MNATPFVFITVGLMVGLLADAVAADLKLPPETAVLKTSPLPGYAIAQQKCGICHSADYVDYQPPNMTVKQWTAEMTKMQHAYGAPISDDEIKLLGVYLASAYGDTKSLTEGDLALKPTAAVAAVPADTTANAPDVQALLVANGCLACHAIDKRIFGPAYHDVAVKYQGDAQAVAHVTTSIRQGGRGKWGTAPMPAFANLSAEEGQALAEYVLKQ